MFGPAKEINVPPPSKGQEEEEGEDFLEGREGGGLVGARCSHRQLTLNPYSSAVIGTS